MVLLIKRCNLTVSETPIRRCRKNVARLSYLLKGESCSLERGSSLCRCHMPLLGLTTSPFDFQRSCFTEQSFYHNDAIMSALASQITSLTSVYSRRRLKKTSKLRVTGLWPVNSPHNGPVTRKMFQFHDVIIWDMNNQYFNSGSYSWQANISNSLFYLKIIATRAPFTSMFLLRLWHV